jgi:hypothetical protein
MSQEEIAQETERLGGLMFSREEVNVILHGEDDSYLRGRLMAEAEIRQSIMDLAKAGSSPAQALAMKLIEDARIKDL